MSELAGRNVAARHFLSLDCTPKGYILQSIAYPSTVYLERAEMNSAPSKNSSDAESKSCCCHHKSTPRTEEMQADLQKRLNRVIGQLNGVKSMIDDNRYCGDVLIQLSAAESAVHSISAILLQNHLETCVVEQVKQGNTDIIDEAMQLIKKFAR